MILALINKGYGNYGMGATALSASDFMVFGGSDPAGGTSTETDPTVPAWVKNITSAQITQWNSSYSWGNHSGLFRPVNWVPTWSEVTNKPTFTRTVAGLVPFPGGTGSTRFLREDGNWATPSGTGGGDSTPDHVNQITTTDISNWNAAYNWDNWATAGLITAVTADGKYMPYAASVSNLNTVPTSEYRPMGFYSGYLPSWAPSTGGNYFSGIQFKHAVAGGYLTQIVTSSAAGEPSLNIRTQYNGTWGGYRRFWHSGDIGQPLDSGSSPTTVKKVEVRSALPTSPSSDTIYFITA